MRGTEGGRPGKQEGEILKRVFGNKTNSDMNVIRASYAARRSPSERERSIRSCRNSARIEFWGEWARNAGRVFLMAMAVTCSDGHMPGRIVRIQEPKEDHTSLGNTEERYWSKPWAMIPI
ncbi:hypothetical protein HKBW3S44_00968 [Candidatus Hakubella thermalkaliphila]|uniref:Uncharacterized protein n=1 Tax=Candidatus Hakubella thermalkaliphila TaxID=2754717 RepID=A0A6V8NQY3_9ACTN|nr:hypothetical protein HKBW3S09_00276 [Candidatus Hakubella thermalkaliphila]GFP30703.1 hypothetical protein HKBW3S34_01623 [Candidatus Hakubella thermalkaliphila]GFP37288.1 hypothetical protein HKBW3S44_00968 [Candidatus Hakubella thermalkaliphila]GFP39696.1 hypothetical protein HKBW3S47_01394 [Candidatus Hakubella thermalkaliphila]